MTNPYEKEIAHDGGWTADCRLSNDPSQATNIEIDWEKRMLDASNPHVSITETGDLLVDN